VGFAAAAVALGCAAMAWLVVQGWLGRVSLYAGLLLLVFLLVPVLRREFWPTRLMRFDFA
jgi:hypothetical protein